MIDKAKPMSGDEREARLRANPRFVGRGRDRARPPLSARRASSRIWTSSEPGRRAPDFCMKWRGLSRETKPRTANAPALRNQAEGSSSKIDCDPNGRGRYSGDPSDPLTGGFNLGFDVPRRCRPRSNRINFDHICRAIALQSILGPYSGKVFRPLEPVRAEIESPRPIVTLRVWFARQPFAVHMPHGGDRFSGGDEIADDDGLGTGGIGRAAGFAASLPRVALRRFARTPARSEAPKLMRPDQRAALVFSGQSAAISCQRKVGPYGHLYFDEP